MTFIDLSVQRRRVLSTVQIASCKCGSCDHDSQGKFQQDQIVGAQIQNLKNVASLEPQLENCRFSFYKWRKKLQRHGWSWQTRKNKHQKNVSKQKKEIIQFEQWRRCRAERGSVSWLSDSLIFAQIQNMATTHTVNPLSKCYLYTSASVKIIICGQLHKLHECP